MKKIEYWTLKATAEGTEPFVGFFETEEAAEEFANDCFNQDGFQYWISEDYLEIPEYMLKEAY